MPQLLSWRGRWAHVVSTAGDSSPHFGRGLGTAALLPPAGPGGGIERRGGDSHGALATAGGGVDSPP